LVASALGFGAAGKVEGSARVAWDYYVQHGSLDGISWEDVAKSGGIDALVGVAFGVLMAGGRIGASSIGGRTAVGDDAAGASLRAAEDAAGMAAARGTRAAESGLDLAELRRIHLKKVGYEDWRTLGSPHRYVEKVKPEKLPKGFVARTYHKDAKTVISTDVYRDPELARKILREEAFHAHRIRLMSPGGRLVSKFLYKRSFFYHMREEAMAHAYAVRLPSGAGYGAFHAWRQVGIFNLEAAAIAGAVIYAVLQDSD
jgi:hypothetical protein